MAPMRSSHASDEAGFKRLVELETEYRTQRAPDQLYAIASFPRLFDEFPYPVIINAGILKLADYFRQRVIHSLDSSEAMEVSAAVYAADMICAQSQRFCAIISGKLAFMVRDTVKTPLPLRRRLIRIFGHMFEDITLARLARKTCLDILELSQDTEYTVAILRTLTRLASHSLVDVTQQIELLLQRAARDSQPGIRRVSLTCLGSLAQKNIEFSPQQIQAIFDIASESRDEKTTLKAMLTLQKIFCLTSAMTSISLMDNGTETMKTYIHTCLLILERSFASLPSVSSGSPPSFKDSGSTWVVLKCYGVLTTVLPYCRQFEAAGFVYKADATFQEATTKVTNSMQQFLIRILSRGQSAPLSDIQEEHPSRAISQEDLAQARMVLWSLTSLTLEEQADVDALLKTLLDWIHSYKDSSALLAKALLLVARQQPKRVYAFQDQLLTFLKENVTVVNTQTFILVFRALLESSALFHASAKSTNEALESHIVQILEQFGRVNLLEQYRVHHWELYQLARYSLQTGWSSLALVALRNQEKSASSVSSSLWLSAVHTMAQIESSLQSTALSVTTTTTPNAAATTDSSAGHNDQGQEEDPGRLDLCSQKQLYTKVISYLEELEAHQVDRSFHLHYCDLRRQYLNTCQSTIGILQLLSTSLEVDRRLWALQDQQQQPEQSSSSTKSQVHPDQDEIALNQCADHFNRLAHQYTILRTSITSTSSTHSSTSAVVVEVPGTIHMGSSSSSLQSDGAIEILQTMCLLLAYAVQRAAKILGRFHQHPHSLSSSSAITTTVATTDVDMTETRTLQQVDNGNEEDDDVFDIDPLLIPLLYLQRHHSSVSREREGGAGTGTETGSRSVLEVFKDSAGKTLGFINDTMVGSSLGDVEMCVSIVRQLIARYVAFPIPIPQEFFVSTAAQTTLTGALETAAQQLV
ncbi:hypothetical protein EDD11_006444 [Mortierella claussenii]|nr:hypothetical protein EDD11_006444 [Mortierella claussenii]